MGVAVKKKKGKGFSQGKGGGEEKGKPIRRRRNFSFGD